MLTTFGGVVGVALMRTDAVVVDVVVGGCGQALPLVAAAVVVVRPSPPVLCRRRSR